MPGRTFRVALVGAGNIATVHAQNLAGLADRVELVAAADIDQDRLDTFCDRWNVPGRFPDLETLLAAARPDLVHLCTPPGLHKQQALVCLDAGVDVLCEKPPTLSLAELDEIARAQTAHGASFATVFQHRFGSGAARLRAVLASGALGRPLVAVCHTLWYRPDDYFAVPWRGKWEIEGGGPTMGHGIHQFDLLLSVLGDWQEITAVAARLARPTATEDLSCALATFADGTVATVVNSLLSPRKPAISASTSSTPPSRSSTCTDTATTTGGSTPHPDTRTRWPPPGAPGPAADRPATPRSSPRSSTRWRSDRRRR